MKSNLLIIILVFFISLIKVNAQNFELGKVSIAELQEKSHPKDTAAVAAILFEKGTNTFEYNQDKGFEVVLKVKTRIKIYKKEGYEWATKRVGYYTSSSLDEKVQFSDAITYNLVNGKIEKTKLKREGEFDEIKNKYWAQKKISMPNVKEGSVIEFEYTIHSYGIGSLREWYFQTNIPVNHSEYQNRVPEYFFYNSNLKGFISPKITVDKERRTIVTTSKESTQTGSGLSTAYQTTYSNNNIEFTETISTYIAENMPAMKEETYVNNIGNYTTTLEQELISTKFPNTIQKDYSTNWDAVVKTIYDYEDFGPELNKTGYFENDLKPILAELNTEPEKIDAILKFAKSAVKWNNYYGYSCNDGVRKAYKDKTGNIAEINLMLTAMLRYAKINANPVLVSTRSNGISFFPNRTAFNYVIAAVENGDKTILLDASEPFATPDVLPFRDLNWLGRLIRKDGTSQQINLMPTNLSNEIVGLNYSVNEKAEVSGQFRITKTNHNAMDFRDEVKDVKEDIYLEKVENKNNKIEINNYSRTNEKDLNLPIIENYSFTGNNFNEIIGGKIYINPMLFLAKKQNPFKQENREYPIDYGFPFQDKYMINIKIPEGYTIEKLPESVNFAMLDKIGSFKYLISAEGNTIQLMVINQMNTAIVSAENYSMLKEYYQKAIDKENEKIVLKKL